MGEARDEAAGVALERAVRAGVVVEGPAGTLTRLLEALAAAMNITYAPSLSGAVAREAVARLRGEERSHRRELEGAYGRAGVEARQRELERLAEAARGELERLVARSEREGRVSPEALAALALLREARDFAPVPSPARRGGLTRR